MLKFVFLLVLAYLIVRSFRNLIQASLGGAPEQERFQQRYREAPESPGSRDQAAPTDTHRDHRPTDTHRDHQAPSDIEDARWTDI